MTQELYLFQHGLSVPKEEDPKQPLSETGRNQTQQIATQLEKLNLKIDQIFHSEKLRAQETAEILSHTWTPTRKPSLLTHIQPLDPPEIIAAQLEHLPNAIALVSHLPYLSKLVSFLLTQNPNHKIVQFQNAGCIALKKIKNHFLIQWILLPQNII